MWGRESHESCAGLAASGHWAPWEQGELGWQRLSKSPSFGVKQKPAPAAYYLCDLEQVSLSLSLH